MYQKLFICYIILEITIELMTSKMFTKYKYTKNNIEIKMMFNFNLENLIIRES